MKNAFRIVLGIMKGTALVTGFGALLMLVLSFTDLPFYAYHALGLTEQSLEADPALIVILGGSGMPSPDGLIRTYYGSRAAHAFPKAEVVIALPYNANEEDSLHQLRLMADELVSRGVDTGRIAFEPIGHNTHTQSEQLASRFSNRLSSPLLIVTSPEHMYRAVRTFEQSGFTQVGSLPAFEVPVDEDKLKDKSAPEDLRVRQVALRYNMWSYLHYELLVLREYAAIAYYWMMGWV